MVEADAIAVNCLKLGGQNGNPGLEVFSMRNFRLYARLLVLAGSIAVPGAKVALAGTIGGPALPDADSGYQYSGLSFTANINATLTGFTFVNQGLADTIVLENSAGTVLDSVATPSGTPSDVVSGLSWSLSSGTLYYLLQTTLNNGYYANFGSAAPSDTEISLVDTGDWSYTSSLPVNFYIGGPSGTLPGTEWWADFNNITTTSAVSSVPEPSSMALLLTGAAAMALAGRRLRRSRSPRP